MKLIERVKELFEDFNAASDELAGEALEVFHIEDIEDLKKDGELVPSTDSTLDSVTSEKSRKSKAPIGPINKMRLFLYSTIKKSLIEIKENTDKKFEENMKDINDNNSEMTTAEQNKKRVETIKLKDKSDKLQDAIEKAEERVEKVESEIRKKIEKNEIEENKSEVQPISVEPITEEQILSDSEQNLAYMVNAIKNNEEKEQEMQPIVTEPAEEKDVQEKNDEDTFNETIAAIDEVYRDAGIVVLSDIQEQYIAHNQKASTKAKDIMAKYMINQINEMTAMQQAYDQQLATQKAEYEEKYTTLEQSTKQTVEQKDKQINELEIKVNNYKTVTEQNNQKISEQEDTIKSKDEEIAKLTEKLAMLEKNNSALEAEVIRLQPYEEKFSSLQNMFVPQPQAVVTEETHKTL